MSTLEKAIQIALQSHAGQKDKAGAPYILHPLRLMLKMGTDLERMAAVLHDVVEDSDWSLEQLREEEFPKEVIKAVNFLTCKEDETYEAFIIRVKTDPIAKTVKIADLQDNLDLGRIENPKEKDFARIEKYKRALKSLTLT